MAGQEWISRWSKYLGAYATNFPNNDIGLDDMGLGTPSEIRSSVNDDDRLLSFFARANYNFREKYLLTATVRADGSSKFAAHNNGAFPIRLRSMAPKRRRVYQKIKLVLRP